MLAICRRLNYRNIELFATTRGQSVGVLLRSGKVDYRPWLGFIDREAAKAIPGAVPVKLVASRYSNEGGVALGWQDLEPGEFVQGCLTSNGVYAVTSAHIRIVRSRSTSASRA